MQRRFLRAARTGPGGSEGAKGTEHGKSSTESPDLRSAFGKQQNKRMPKAVPEMGALQHLFRQDSISETRCRAFCLLYLMLRACHRPCTLARAPTCNDTLILCWRQEPC